MHYKENPPTVNYNQLLKLSHATMDNSHKSSFPVEFRTITLDYK